MIPSSIPSTSNSTFRSNTKILHSSGSASRQERYGAASEMLSMIDQSGGTRLLSRLKQAKAMYTEQLSSKTMSDQIYDENGRLVQEKERHWRDGGGSSAMNGVNLMGKKGLLEQIK
ncbi:hypothetical protein TrRE_jg6643, partial [Triparma retinervis]